MNGKDKKGFLKDLGERLKKLFPDENVEGQPFWGLMELSKGRITGNYYVFLVEQPDIKMVIPLFFRETDAEIFLSTRSVQDKRNYVIRGFTKEQLRLLTFPDDKANLMFWVFQKPKAGEVIWPYLVYNTIDLANEYLI